MTGREQFECKCRNGLINGGLTKHENGNYASELTDAAWRGWQASCEAVVVELPDEMKAREALDKGFMCDYAAGVTDTVVQMRENLLAAGIKVKGG